MNVLILGNAGREAAIARELLFSKKIQSLYITPENRAFHGKIKTEEIPLHDQKKIFEFVKKNNINLVVIGPEKPLVDGFSDLLRNEGVAVFGPSQKGAMLEGSKLFCKEILEKANVPTAHFAEVEDYDDLLEKAKRFEKPWIVKADGLAAGKGVYVCNNEEELKQAGRDLLKEKKLGSMRVFIEEYIGGKELSYLVLTNGKEFEPLVIAQDHKRIFDLDKGPNTGGMGAVAPLKISDDLDKKIKNLIVKPTLEQISKERIDYRGVIYFGLMVKDNNPYVLEINARFGDPETQVIMPLLEGDWGEVFWDISQGVVKKLKWKRLYATAVVLAAPGYPDKVEKGLFIDGNIFSENQGAYFLCAGVGQNAHGQWITTGGRVINAIGVAETAKKSVEITYGHSEKVKWRGLQKRLDIGQKVIKNNEFVF